MKYIKKLDWKIRLINYVLIFILTIISFSCGNFKIIAYEKKVKKNVTLTNKLMKLKLNENNNAIYLMLENSNYSYLFSNNKKITEFYFLQNGVIKEKKVFNTSVADFDFKNSLELQNDFNCIRENEFSYFIKILINNENIINEYFTTIDFQCLEINKLNNQFSFYILEVIELARPLYLNDSKSNKLTPYLIEE